MTATASMLATSMPISSPSPPRPATPISPLQLKLDNISRPRLKVKTDLTCAEVSTTPGAFPRGESHVDEGNQHNDIDRWMCSTRRASPTSPTAISYERSEQSSPPSSAVLYSSPCSSVAAAEAVLTPSSPVEDTKKSILILDEPASESDDVGEEGERAGLLTKHAAILSEIVGLRTPPASSAGNDSDDDGEEEGGMRTVCSGKEGNGKGSGNGSGHVAGGNELGNADMDGAEAGAGWVDVRMVDAEDEKEQRMNVKRRRVKTDSSPPRSEMAVGKAVGPEHESAEEKSAGGGKAMDLCACEYCPGHRKRDGRGA